MKAVRWQLICTAFHGGTMSIKNQDALKWSVWQICLLVALIWSFPGVDRALAAEYHFEDFGDTILEVSQNQDDARSVRYYATWGSDEWTACSDEVAFAGVVTDVEFEFPKEVSEFTIAPTKGDPVIFKIDQDDLPESRKWIISTLIKKGIRLQTVSRACGSGVVPYLVSAKRASLPPHRSK